MARPRPSLKDVFNKLRGEAMTASCWSWSLTCPRSSSASWPANEEAVKTEQAKNDIIANRTVKAAVDVANLMEDTVAGAQKGREDLQGRGHGRYRSTPTRST
jgi:hypothetical protein